MSVFRRLRGPLLGAAAAVLVLGAATALAGSGVGAVFNLGQTNTVNGTSALTGTTSGAQLQVVNNGGGTAVQANVSGNTVAPLSVNSNHVVPNLHAANSDALGGYPATSFYRFRPVPVSNTITTLDSSGNVGEYDSLTIGSDGLGLISYYDRTNGDLKVAHCDNPACSSATITPLDTTGDVGEYTSIALGRDGLGLISYYDSANQHLKVAHCSNVACTSATITTLDPGPADVGLYSSITIGADGLGLIAYLDETNGDVKIAHCSDLDCTSATFQTIGGVATDFSLTVGADGLPLLSEDDLSIGSLIVIHCTTRTCSSFAPPTTVDNDTGVQVSSITISPDGLGLISYGKSGSLMVAHCADIACSSTTSKTIDTGTSRIIGVSSSMTVAPDGLGVIGYTDNPNLSGKPSFVGVALCSTLDCSVGGPVKLGGTTSGNLDYTSITIGADGLPLLSYYSSGSGTLKVLHCGSPMCAAFYRER
jgi:hypothetical protein